MEKARYRQSPFFWSLQGAPVAGRTHGPSRCRLPKQDPDWPATLPISQGSPCQTARNGLSFLLTLHCVAAVRHRSVTTLDVASRPRSSRSANKARDCRSACAIADRTVHASGLCRLDRLDRLDGKFVDATRIGGGDFPDPLNRTCLHGFHVCPNRPISRWPTLFRLPASRFFRPSGLPGQVRNPRGPRR